RHTRLQGDWSSDVCSSDLGIARRNGMTGAADAVIGDWEDIIAINLTGVFNVTHAFLAPLRAAKGRIVNIGSIQSFVHLRTPSSQIGRASCREREQISVVTV